MFSSVDVSSIPNALGNTIPQKATFFMTYILVDGWTSTAAQILRLWQLLRYHFKNLFLVRSEREQMKVIPATAAHYDTLLSRISLYFLLGLVYSAVSPLILPFICVYFGFGYIVYRNQVRITSYVISDKSVTIAGFVERLFFDCTS